jgi:F-type H+-transporting ATPase subunit delta
MAELSALYSTALFELALEGGAGVIDEIYEQATVMREVLRDPECHKALVHPHIKNAEKIELFGSAFGGGRKVSGGIHEYLMNLLCLAIEKNREPYLAPALKDLIGRIERFRGEARAEVLTPCKMDAAQAAEIKKLLSEKLLKKVEIVEKVDPNLIGGPLIRVDGYILDQTVKMRLREMSAEMKEGWGV